jgi:hypothetical protein
VKPEQPQGHRKHFPPRRVDPDWEVPKTEILMMEKEAKHEPIAGPSRPFHLQFHTPAQPEPTQTEVLTIPPKPAEERSDRQSGKRLRPISSSITPEVPPSGEQPSQDDPGMSSIIRNLGQLIWKNRN